MIELTIGLFILYLIIAFALGAIGCILFLMWFVFKKPMGEY